MKQKIFIVSHAKAREPLRIVGTSLSQALSKERLDPNIWHLDQQLPMPSEVKIGEDP